MGKVKHTIKGKSSKELAGATPAGGAQYAGKKPPKGVYRGKLRFFGLRYKDGKPQKNTNGDYMIRGAVQIQEKGRNEKYNGYLINFQQNVSDQGAPYVNTMLNAISGGSESYREGFWEHFVSTDEKGYITRVGTKRYTDNEVEVIVSAKDDNGGDTPRLTVGAWLLPSAAEEEDDDDDSDDEDIDTDDADDDDDESDDDDSDDDEDDDESDDDESDDDDDDDEADDEDDEEDDDDDEDEEDEAEEDEADESEARVAELTALSRPELVKLAKDLKVKTGKSISTETLIANIVEAEGEEPPF